MVGEVRHPAGDPALRAARRRQARPAPRHPVLDPRRVAPRGTTTLATWRLTHRRGDEITLPLLRDGHRLPVDAEGARHRGHRRFQGDVYFTSRWPHEGVDFTGKRVGGDRHRLVGHPVDPADRRSRPRELTVFQRTPNFSMPANNGPVPDASAAALEPDRDAYREAGRGRRRCAARGQPAERRSRSATRSACARYEKAWEGGGIVEFLGTYSDHLTSTAGERPRGRVHARQDPLDRGRPGHGRGAVPEHDHPSAPSGSCVDTGYYETFNLPHVRLVDLRKHPITTITETGIDTRRRVARVRRHRVRHGIRRDDRRHRRRRHHGPRRSHAQGQVGARPDHLPRAHGGRLPEPVHDHRPRQPVGAVEHDGVHRAARRLDRATASSTSATDGSTRHRAHGGRPWPAGCSTSTTTPTSR